MEEQHVLQLPKRQLRGWKVYTRGADVTHTPAVVPRRRDRLAFINQSPQAEEDRPGPTSRLHKGSTCTAFDHRAASAT